MDPGSVAPDHRAAAELAHAQFKPCPVCGSRLDDCADDDARCTACLGPVPCAAHPNSVPSVAESTTAVLAQLRGEVLAMRSELAALHEALRPVLELVEQARQIPRLAAQLRKVER